MPWDVNRIISLEWLALWVFWLVTFYSRSARRTLRSPSLSFYRVLEVLAFVFLFYPRIRVGPLAWQLMPASPVARYLGVAITAYGLAFAIWARGILGHNWSASPSIVEGHTLINRGPYRLVRHPIYTGLLVAMIGTAIAFGYAACFLAFPVGLTAWWLKSKREESLLTQEFGDGYQRYRATVKDALIPFVI